MTTAVSQQALDALAIGNEIRTRRAVEKRKIAKLPMKEGREVVAGWLDDTPNWLQSETVSRLLAYPRSTGRAYAARMLVHIANPFWPVGENTRVGQLTPLHRERLAKVLREGWSPDA